MTEALPMAGATANVNLAGLSKNDYRGAPSTLCQGCGHNSISNQIITALYEMNITPENVVKFSGIGCSSKSPTYILTVHLASTACMDACRPSRQAHCLAIIGSKALAFPAMATRPASVWDSSNMSCAAM